MTDPSKSVLAIDIGGTKIAFADVEDDRVRNRHQVITPRTGRGADLVDAITAEFSRRHPLRIAVATTGMVSGGAVTALNPATLPIENGFPLARRIEEVTGLRPTLINDAHAAAWGEYRFGAGRGFRNFMFVTVSTGIGGGIILERQLQLGQTGLAGHVGHVSVPDAVSLCGCGRRGCLETVASGTAISRRFGESSGRHLATPEIFGAASEGDALAERIIEESAAALAAAFADVVATVDHEVIALGGGVGLAAGFLDRVCKRSSRLPSVFQREIVRAQAGPDAGLIGVASLAGENFHHNYNLDK